MTKMYKITFKKGRDVLVSHVIGVNFNVWKRILIIFVVFDNVHDMPTMSEINEHGGHTECTLNWVLSVSLPN